MICKWCKGTCKECGCGEGYCAHCFGGETADPPYGPQRYLNADDQVTNAIDGLFDFHNPDWFRNACFGICYRLAPGIVLEEDEFKLFKDYWDNPWRDETVGDTIQRVAMFILDKQRNEK